MPAGVTGVTPLRMIRSLIAGSRRHARHRAWLRLVTLFRSVRRMLAAMAVTGGHRDVDSRQQCEDQRLDRAEEQLQDDEHHRHQQRQDRDRKSTRLNSSHTVISYAVFCLKKKENVTNTASQLPSTQVITSSRRRR